MTKLLPYAFVVGLLLAVAYGVSYAFDPNNAARAEARRAQAAVDTAAAQQALAQQLAQFQLQQAEAEALAYQWVLWKTTIGWVCVTGVSVIVLSNSSGVALVAFRVWRAFADSRELRARLVPLDPKTGQFPMIQYVGKGYITMTNMNTGQTRLLNMGNEADRAMVEAAGNVQLAGVLSKNAASHKSNPGGVSAIGWPALRALFGRQEEPELIPASIPVSEDEDDD